MNKSLLIVIIIIFVIFAGFYYSDQSKSNRALQQGSAKIEFLDEKTFDWGEIDINGGNVERVFRIKNSSDNNLEIKNFKTSCACTEVQITINDEVSPPFGMHTTSKWIGVIKPNEEATIRVVFDPLFHGPQGIGPITRIVSFNTNDINNKTVELKLTGNVVDLNKMR